MAQSNTVCIRTSAPRAQNAAAPFCSVRCKQVDLGAWLDESYRAVAPKKLVATLPTK